MNKSYMNSKGEKIIVYPNGFKIKESLLLKKQEQHKIDYDIHQKELRQRWLEWCIKYDLDPDD